MPRLRRYHSAAEKQAAYRTKLVQETVLLDRNEIEKHEQRLLALQKAVREAAERGDEFARECQDSQTETMLERMIVAFNNRHMYGSTERAERVGKEVNG